MGRFSAQSCFFFFNFRRSKTQGAAGGENARRPGSPLTANRKQFKKGCLSMQKTHSVWSGPKNPIREPHGMDDYTRYGRSTPKRFSLFSHIYIYIYIYNVISLINYSLLIPDKLPIFKMLGKTLTFRRPSFAAISSTASALGSSINSKLFWFPIWVKSHRWKGKEQISKIFFRIK